MANIHDVDHSARPSTSGRQEPSQPPDIPTRGEGPLPRREVGGDTVRVQVKEETDDKMTFDPSEGGQSSIAFDGENVADTTEINDEQSIYYDCAPVIAATSHITNRRDAFVSYQSMHDTQIGGMGSSNARVEGRGTIELESQCEGKKYAMTLQDVLYIPSNKHNLLSLGKWTAAGGRFIGGDGTLSLISKSGKCVAQGTKMENNLYKMRFTIRKPSAVPDRQMTVGELTHIDLSGQYGDTSVNGHHYHLLFIDEWARYMTVEFLKSESQVTEKVKNYLSYLKNHGMEPRAIRVDGGKDLITGELRAWCADRGIGIQVIALRSPLQIRDDILAEEMNRALVRLARILITAKGLPEFLWEPAIAHAAYVKNLYDPTIEYSTPYQRWNNTKPNVSHLREFGAPVWIVPQGQELRRELLPLARGHGRAFVGYDETEGTRSVKYYDAETKKVLTSRNFRFISPREGLQVDPEGIIVIAPDTIVTTHEGESAAGGSTRRATSGKARDGARVVSC